MQHFPTARQDADWLDETKAERVFEVTSLPADARTGMEVWYNDGLYRYVGGEWQRVVLTPGDQTPFNKVVLGTDGILRFTRANPSEVPIDISSHIVGVSRSSRTFTFTQADGDTQDETVPATDISGKLDKNLENIDVGTALTTLEDDDRIYLRDDDDSSTRFKYITWDDLRSSIMESGGWTATNSGAGTVTDFSGTYIAIGDVVQFEGQCKVAGTGSWRTVKPELSLPLGTQAADVNGRIENAADDFIARVETQENYTYEVVDELVGSGNTAASQVLQVVRPTISGTADANRYLYVIYKTTATSGNIRIYRYTLAFGTWTGALSISVSNTPTGGKVTGRPYFIAVDGNNTYIYWVRASDNRLLRKSFTSATALGTTSGSTVGSVTFANTVAFGSLANTYYRLDNDSTIRTVNISTGAVGSPITLNKQLDGLVWGGVMTSAGTRLAGWVSNNSDPLMDGLHTIDVSNGNVAQINNYRKFAATGFVESNMIYTSDGERNANDDYSPSIVSFFPSSSTTVTLVDTDASTTPANGMVDLNNHKLRLNVMKRVSDANVAHIYIRGSYRKAA